MELVRVGELVLTDLGGPRSPGVHLSQIIRDMEVEMGKDRSDVVDDRVRALWEAGFIWEELYGHHFRERQARRDPNQFQYLTQYEIALNGIYMTPDAIRAKPRILILEETKATYRSSRPFDEDPVAALFEDFWSWGAQMMGYCHALGITRADLIVFWIMGAWRPFGPKAKKYSFRFSPEELIENWSVILQHRKRMLRDGKLTKEKG